MLNNPQKISPSLFLSLEEVEVDDKMLLYVYIPISAQVELCSGKIYDRIEDADIDVTKSTDLAAQLYGRKAAAYTEREIFPYVTEKELRFDLIERAQKMAIAINPDHPWVGMSPMELLRNTKLYEEDWRTGKKGFNLAAILLFGRDDVIASCAPGYLTDALLRRENVDRYDDRLTVGTNLIEAYDQLKDFIAKHTLDKFFLMDNQRVSVRDWIARELVSNLLVHREFSKGFLARLIIEKDRIYAENWNRSNAHGRIDPNDFAPDAKNPLLAWFFVNIGRADYMGSGVRNLYKFTKVYSGGEPELIEGDIFKTIIPIANVESLGTSDTQKVSERVAEKLSDGEAEVLTQIVQNREVTQNEMAEQLGVSRKTIYVRIKSLKAKGVIRRVGSDTKGHWEVIDDSDVSEAHANGENNIE